MDFQNILHLNSGYLFAIWGDKRISVRRQKIDDDGQAFIDKEHFNWTQGMLFDQDGCIEFTMPSSAVPPPKVKEFI